MSTKRIFGITAFGVLFIVAVIGIMLLSSYLRRDNGMVSLPDVSTSPGTVKPIEAESAALSRVEVTRETVRAVVSGLSRPESYTRNVEIESIWEGGQASYNIEVAVDGGLTSLRTLTVNGVEKRIVITPDTLYIWYTGDSIPYVGKIDSPYNEYKTADEYQMLITYEDILGLDANAIIDAGYTGYAEEDCVFIAYLSPEFGYTGKYYISIDLGLVTGAEEYDETGMLVYRMTTSEYTVGEVDPAVFSLPDGTNLAAR